MAEIDRRGTYDLTFKELSFGCRMAWRNAPRCMNRIQWRKLHVLDQRDVRTEEEMFAAMVHHIRFCSNPENPGVLRYPSLSHTVYNPSHILAELRQCMHIHCVVCTTLCADQP